MDHICRDAGYDPYTRACPACVSQMSKNAAPKARPMPVPVGFQYRHTATGKEWIVTGLRPGGVCEISAVGRYVTGEMYARDIRAGIEAGTHEGIEQTDAGRAVLRRCNA